MKLSFAWGVIISLLLVSKLCHAQYKLPLFDDRSKIKMVQRCIDHLYNREFDEANTVFEDIKIALPGHPAIDMIEAFFISWQQMPFNAHSPGYQRHVEKLREVIKKSELILDEQPGHQEAIFFEMSARGLLAEYYADEGSYMKAVSEAKQTYDLIKLGFELTEENPEFLFTVGLYNYFRVKYPERHPVYKPFLWFFKNGDKELGLRQLEQACRLGVLTKVEAHLYTSYVYLRYENDAEKALKFLRKLNRDYPKNPFFQTKLAEALVMNERYKEADPLATELIKNADPYYRMSGHLFLGLIADKKPDGAEVAKKCYEKALSEAAGFEYKGEYYKSLAYLGLGRIHKNEGQTTLANEEFNLAIEWATTEEVEKEAKSHLKNE